MVEQFTESSRNELPSFDFKQRITQHTYLLVCGTLSFLIFNIVDLYGYIFGNWINTAPVLSYIIYGLMLGSLIPIAVAIQRITKDFFFEHVTKIGLQIRFWLFLYGGSVLLNLAFFGWPGISSWVGVVMIVARIVGFYKIYRLFSKIKFVTEIKVGGLLYLIYSFYSIVVSLFAQLASTVEDDSISYFMAVYSKLGEVFFAVIMCIKLVIDAFRLREYFIERNLPAEKIKDVLRVKDYETRKLREKEIQLKQRKVDVELKEVEERAKFESKRTLSLDGEKLLQNTVITASLVALVVYSFFSSNSNSILITISFVLLGIFILYLLIRYVVFFFLGAGTRITNIVNDLLFLFLYIPAIITSLSFLFVMALNGIIRNGMSNQLQRGLIIGISVGLELLIVIIMINLKLRETGMNLREYISYRLDKDKREKEKKMQTETIERKRKNFDSLDRLSANIAKQRQDRAMAYEEFDFKERVNSLGRGTTRTTKCWSCGDEIDEKAENCSKCKAKQRV